MVAREEDPESHSTFGGGLSQVNDSTKIFQRRETQTEVNFKNLTEIFNGHPKGICKSHPFQ